MHTSRYLALLGLLAACGTGENRVDPGDLELRDLLGIAPDTALSWDADQRAAARRVIDDGIRRADGSLAHAPLGKEIVLDHRVARALVTADGERAAEHVGALGLVRVGFANDELVATPRASSITAHASADIRLSGWTDPAWRRLPERGIDILSRLASDAGHTTGPLLVTPAARLPVVAGYVPASGGEAAHLVVNPVLLAALEPVESSATTEARSAAGGAPFVPPATAIAASANPYDFYTSIASCAAAQKSRCDACLPSRTCKPITNTSDGNGECSQLALQDGRGYALICIDLALAIDAVAGCSASTAPQCTQDVHAGESLSTIENNKAFLDDAACSGTLDACLAGIYGNAPSPAPDPTPAAASCDDSTCEDIADGCSDVDCGGTCESDDSSSCEDTGSSSSGDCSDSSGGDSCGGSDGGGDCGDSGGDCGGDSGSSCDSGGDCGGGGGCGDSGDCNAGGGRRRGSHLGVAVVWAFLPVPFALLARRRSKRSRTNGGAS